MIGGETEGDETRHPGCPTDASEEREGFSTQRKAYDGTYEEKRKERWKKKRKTTNRTKGRKSKRKKEDGLHDRDADDGDHPAEAKGFPFSAPPPTQVQIQG